MLPNDGLDTDPNPFRYCGEYFDVETNEIYLRNRSYNAANGRFSKEDPARAQGNWYIYCLNNPLARIDPNGTDAILLTDKSGGWVGSGHTTLLLQDETGTWHMANFGSNQGNGFGVGEFIYEDIDIPASTSATDLATGEVRHPSLDRYLDEPGDTIQYISGDFSTSCELANYYLENQPFYRLTATNCSWISLRLLQASYSCESQIYQDLQRTLYSGRIVPTGMGTTQYQTTIIPNLMPSLVDYVFGNLVDTLALSSNASNQLPGFAPTNNPIQEQHNEQNWLHNYDFSTNNTTPSKVTVDKTKTNLNPKTGTKTTVYWSDGTKTRVVV